MPSNEISIESFHASLKRIERQYGSRNSSSSSPATAERRIRRPPDEAGYALGKGMARSLLELSAATATSSIPKETQEEIFTLLSNRDINPGVCQGFFDALLELVKHEQRSDLDLDDLLTTCILFTEQSELQSDHFNDDDENDDPGAVFGPLTCMIRAYAFYVRFECERESLSNDGELSSCTQNIARTYSKLQTVAGRLAMLREFANVAFMRTTQQDASPNVCSDQVYKCILNPLLICSVLSPKNDHVGGVGSSMVESILCMESIWRQVDFIIDDATYQDENYRHLYIVLDVTVWMTKMLDLFLLSIASQKHQQRIMSKDLAHRWLASVLDIGLFLAESFEDDDHIEKRQALLIWFEGILSRSLLRWFSVVPSYQIGMKRIWTPIHKLMAMYASEFSLSLESTLKISTMALCNPMKEDVKEILNIFAIAIQETPFLHPISISMIKGLGSVFSRDSVCAATANCLLQASTQTELLSSKVTPTNASESLSNIIQVFEDRKSIDLMMPYFISYANDLYDTNRALSAIQQTGSLVLFGVGLLYTNDTKQRRFTYVLLRKLLKAYPHLGITLLPVMVDSINASAVRGDGELMMEQIEFLCEVLVLDSQCAREVWNLFGTEFIRESVPVTIRSSIIRLFPTICKANKRLYKRVIQVMGDTLAESNSSDEKTTNDFELRLAIAASTAELAQNNFIRDPTDVISWLQDFITDTGWVRPISTLHKKELDCAKTTMAHYSISALNSLVVAGELDFKLVLVVLSKKLCNVHEIDEVARLPHLVLESIILLLGAGESEEDSSDDDSDHLEIVGISPQTSRSVDTLINLWNHECLRPEHFAAATSKAIIFRCRRNILRSLSGYSFEALGVDEEGIRSACSAACSDSDDKPRNLVPSGKRYNALKSIISDGIKDSNTLRILDDNLLYKLDDDPTKQTCPNYSVALSTFTCKVLKYEEDILGSSLWQKRQNTSQKKRKTKTTNKRKTDQPNLSEQLPSPKSVLDSYYENRDQATSIGALMSFEGGETSLLSDLVMDATSNHSDAMFLILYIQSWMNAARSALYAIVSTASITNSLENLLNNMQECHLDNPDSTYMFLSAIATLIPTILGPHGDFSVYIRNIWNDIWEAYHDQKLFENSDVSFLCLGLLGVCNLSLGTTNRLIEIVDSLEKTTIGYGGLPSFGAYYGLAIIAQKCTTYGDERAIETEHDLVELKERIFAFLIDELASCVKGEHAAFNILVSCIKDRFMSPEKIGILTTLQKRSLKFKKSKTIMSRSIFIALGICFPGITERKLETLPPIISFLESFEWGSGVGFCLQPILHNWCRSSLVRNEEIEEKRNAYSTLLKEGSEQQHVNVSYDILYAMTAIQLKPDSNSSENIRMITTEVTEKSIPVLSAVSSIVSIPCLGHSRLVTDSPHLLETATYNDVAAVVQYLSEVSFDTATILRGLLSSLTKFNELDHGNDSQMSIAPLVGELNGISLPEPFLGTTLGIIMTNIHHCIQENNDLDLAMLLQYLEVTALPNQFSNLVETLTKDEGLLKCSCIRLMISQIKGRPRAVFDGREFVNLALKICKMSVVSMRKTVGNKDAAEIFIDAFGDMLTKFISTEVESVIENIFRFCTDQIDQNPALIVKLLHSIKCIFQQAKNDKSPRFSPKCLNALYLFLQQKTLLGIHDATSMDTYILPPQQITEIVKAYADCVVLIPEILLVDNNILITSEHIGFKGECLRIRIMMSIIRDNSFPLLSHSYREIISSMAWVSQQLISGKEDVFSPIILRAVCTIVGAVAHETKEKKSEVLLTFLDNMLMVDSTVSFVCLKILSAFAFQFCDGHGSDGDLSLLRAFGPSIEKWIDLPVELLEKAFKLAVHDLPFNLAKFSRRGNYKGIVFNRLSGVYAKWLAQGADETSLAPLRLSIFCCHEADSATNTYEFVTMIASTGLNEK